MKKILMLAVTVGLIMTLGGIAAAAPPDGRGKPKPDDGGGGGTSSSSTLGFDISWPQCGRTLPTDFAFAIVGVNDGTASTKNRCLVEQLRWATGASGSVEAQDPLQLYVNTANPWDDIEEYNVTTWPVNNIDSLGNNTLNPTDQHYKNPHGACTASNGSNTNSLACSWQYGWNRAVVDVQEFFKSAAEEAQINTNPSAYYWWLDVETENSWQAVTAENPAAKDKNRATLEGMTAYFKGVIGARVGVYSTTYQYGLIAGTVPPSSNLHNLDSWLAGARNQKDALSRCNSSPALTSSSNVSLVQYISKNLDHNVAC